MSTRIRRPPVQQNEPALDWTPTQAAPEPILNSPYKEPAWHWTYIDGVPSKQQGRRPASYWYRTQRTGTDQGTLFAEEERDELPLVNALREDVKRWRDSGYRGATPVTRDLFAHWFSLERHRPLFFCQREAVETIVYLLELGLPGRLGASGYRNFQVDAATLEALLAGPAQLGELKTNFLPRLVDIPADPELLPLRRMGCKMATGSGKTLVMAMLISWAFCNRGRTPASTNFPSAVLVCAPNLTVKNRLQVLRPDDIDNYYDAFDLVPAKYRELLNTGKVLVTNWHAFALKSPHSEGGTSYKVVDKGEESNDAFSLDRLGELAARLPILVLNDEGHHCWRPNPDAQAEKLSRALTREEREAIEEEAEGARVWLAGLDRINNSGLLPGGQPAILAAVDLSATPFYLANSGYPEGSPFPWLVSDFGLVDAIESGIVKVPRLPVKDDTSTKDEAGRPDPKYFRLWEHVKEKLVPKADFVAKRPKPEAVYREAEGALITLASQWKERFEQQRKDSHEPNPIPPVMIVVCDNTELAELVFQKISGDREEEVLGEDGKPMRRKVYEGSQIGFPELANSETERHTVRIDSKLLAKIETETGETRDEAARALRDVIDTVGRRNGAGEQVRCVVSVSMLTEGWDANNVTHILGIRAFGSQLLCEQVVGRGLRRVNYTPDPDTGLLPAEYVDVYGIPFSLIPFKGRTEKEKPNDVVYHHIFALPEREEDFEIRIPVVESYTYDLKGSGITCDVDALEGFQVSHEPTAVYLAPTRGYRDAAAHGGDHEEYVKQTREAYYASVRFQQILFRLTQLVVDDLIAHGEGVGVERLRKNLLARHTLFPEVLRIVQDYVARKVEFAPGVDRRELGLEKYATLLRQRIRDGIVDYAAPKDAPLLPILNSFHPEVKTGDVVDYTSRPVVPLVKSHLNFAPILSGWESQAIDILEDTDAVEAFTPNLRKLGFQIHYEYGEQMAHYEPDFVVRLRNGKLLVLEIKGKKGEVYDPDRVNAKSAAAKKWVAAVNNARRYGMWDYEICRDLAKLRGVLAEHARVDQAVITAAAEAADTEVEATVGEDTKSTGAVVLPFPIITNPAPTERYRTCVPLTTLRAAAGSWSEEQTELEGLADWAEEWAMIDDEVRLQPGMFVARVVGRSMEPEIPAGAYCLFRQPSAGSRQGKRVLVWHEGVSDPETGGTFTVKVFTSEKASDAASGWRHERIVLRALNPDYEPVVLTPEEEGQVRVVAEVVRPLVPVPAE